jgi:signal transduction histidine kinase
VTEEKLADEELMRMKKHESLGAFAGGVAQDFDSLMSAVLRNIFLAKLTAVDEDKLMEEGLATAEKAGLQAKELAHRLITFAKGGYAMRKTESVTPLLREAVETAGSPPRIRWNLSVPDGLWPVEMDSRQIRQVLENLIRNGLEAMPEGGTLDVAAECITIGERNIHNLKQGPYVSVSIRDSGAGFPKEDLSKIFDPYFTATGDRKGAGLGLSICYSILKHHDGTIAVESEPGEGTTFRLFLPAVPGGSRDTATVENGAGPAQ